MTESAPIQAEKNQEDVMLEEFAKEEGAKEETKPEIKEESKPEVKEEIKEEIKPETKPEEKPDKPPPGYVKHEALHEERARRKEFQGKVSELEKQLARMDERLKVLNEKPKVVPDPEEDPEGYRTHQLEELKHTIEAQKKEIEESKSRLEKDINVLTAKTHLENLERAFEKNHPDYEDSVDYFINTRKSVFADLGLEEEEIKAAIDGEVGAIIKTAMVKGKNPAEAIYRMSEKMGYKKPEKKDDPAQKIEALEKSANSKSLSQAGTNVTRELTAEIIANMSDEEFQKITEEDLKKVFA